MKIGIICGMEFSRPTGISRYVIEITKILADIHDVHLLCTDRPPLVGSFTVHLSPLRFFTGGHWRGLIPQFDKIRHITLLTLRQVFSLWYYPWKIRKLREIYRLDIIHTQNVDSPVGDVVTMHSCLKAAEQQKKSHTGQNPLLRFLGYTVFLPFRILYLTTEEQILKNSKKIIAVSNEVRDQILALYQIPVEKIVVIPNGVDLARFKPDAEKRARIRKELAIGNDDRVLIFIGHLFEIKGLDYVLDAIKLLPEMRLIVVGEGVNIHSYKQRIAMQGRDRQVCFLGTVLKHNEDYYSAADVFILPSESEGFPLAALEAAASGLPLITTRTGGLSDLVVPGENGFFIQRDAVEIRDVLLRLTKDSELMRRMGARSRERAQSYSWDETVRRIEMVYHQILTK